MDIEVPRVYGASKLEQKVTEAPSSVTIVTADEVKKYGYRTLADILAERSRASTCLTTATTRSWEPEASAWAISTAESCCWWTATGSITT